MLDVFCALPIKNGYMHVSHVCVCVCVWVCGIFPLSFTVDHTVCGPTEIMSNENISKKISYGIIFKIILKKVYNMTNSPDLDIQRHSKQIKKKFARLHIKLSL